MKKSLLLVFIHGFKGDNDTFGSFPERLKAVVGRCLPNVQVATAVYPRYDTRGELKECVANFREWLQNQVIDLEVENQTPSPTVDPSVHVFLIGHSMGGIVAAESLILLASEQPIPPKSATAPEEDTGKARASPVVEPGSFMFPHIQGVLAFDTPFLGIAPGVISYGAEGHYKNASSAYSAVSEVAGLFGFGGNSASSPKGATNQEARSKQQTPAVTNSPEPSTDAAATPSWQRWGRYAMFAGAAGAVAAGGAAAIYSQRHNITSGWGWISSHLEFVGCLTRSAEMRQRLDRLAEVQRDRGIGCINYYTCLGKNASALVENTGPGQTSFSQKIIRSKHRTFCTLPVNVEGRDLPVQEGPGLGWVRAVNDNASDEVKAHISMFLPKQNPAFLDLVGDASKWLVKSVDKSWYSSATVDERIPRTDNSKGADDTDNGFMDGDDVVVVD
ncbi:hypothetical protein P168DRAFT_278327 [Aspergillus campestris IBT 28561]|uniref:DUF676 domain-containing protein n=1 Tax=Aspergillus campestris (strain IBT 28561) TaxID=1392248 RepID=A0A2I1DFY2_ASPC2|nr:uncharacterized protein P168DRAFT_278327 [Aspergillus campestris IBT 28561]PKY08770.1 hypothetical protein P168DRAFT_278327 [Aspergillus campestris IBT 28561]